jgi:hypothetical protein
VALRLWPDDAVFPVALQGVQAAQKLRKGTPMTDIEIVQLTPELAREYLAANTQNYRQVNEAGAQQLANAMRRGEFNSQVPSNDAITFSDDGILTNGQHRCIAVVRSGVTIPVIVMHGGSVDMADVIDTGMKRPAGSVLKHHGYDDATNLASTVRAYALVMNGYQQNRLTTPQIIGFVEKHHTALHRAVQAGRGVGQVGIPRASAAGVHFAASQVDLEEADELFARIADGEGLYAGSPALTLRRRMQQLTRGRTDRTYVTALLIKTWNAWHKRQNLSVLKWRSGQYPDEEFPKPVSYRTLIPLSEKETS